jgi:hypothetical protein
MANPEYTFRTAGRFRLNDLDMCYRLVSGLVCLWGVSGEAWPRLLPSNFSPMMMTTIALISILLLHGGERMVERRFHSFVMALCFAAETYLLIRTGQHPVLAASSGLLSLFFLMAALAMFIDLAKMREWATRHRAS